MLELEKLRKKYFLKLIFILSILIPLFIICIVFLNSKLESVFLANGINLTACIVIFVSVIMALLGLKSIVSAIGKDFENIVKRNCINDIIANFLDGKGKIMWQELVNDFSEEDEFNEKIKKLAKEKQWNLTEEECQKLEQELQELENKPKMDYYKRVLMNNRIRNTGLFSYNLHNEDDIFIGEYKGQKIEIMESEFSKRGRRFYFTVFKGVVITIKSRKKFRGNTLVGKNHHLDFTGLEKLNHPDLSKKFDIYTNDFSGVGQTLTPELCDFLLNFKYKISISFKDNCITAAINFGRDVFKLGSLFKNVNDTKQYQKFLQDFSVITDVIENVCDIK